MASNNAKKSLLRDDHTSRREAGHSLHFRFWPFETAHSLKVAMGVWGCSRLLNGTCGTGYDLTEVRGLHAMHADPGDLQPFELARLSFAARGSDRKILVAFGGLTGLRVQMPSMNHHTKHSFVRTANYNISNGLLGWGLRR